MGARKGRDVPGEREPGAAAARPGRKAAPSGPRRGMRPVSRGHCRVPGRRGQDARGPELGGDALQHGRGVHRLANVVKEMQTRNWKEQYEEALCAATQQYSEVLQ